MPTFKFRGFTSASLVALTVAQGAQSASATTTWASQSSPNASFAIQLVDGCTDVVAPYGAVFRATGFAGFNVSEPAGDTNVYDPTQHRITLIWDFDDPGYGFARDPNIPTAWRNLNLAYGRQVAHVWHTPGSYTVTCFAFDTAGNWGTASYTFASGGNSPAIADPSTFFAGANTIVWSQAGDFTGAPSGATQCTTIAQVHDALRARMNANNRSLRVLMRAGETFQDNWVFTFGDGVGTPSGFPSGTAFNYRDGMKGCHFGSFGPGARPIIRYTSGQTKPPFSFPDRSDTRQLVISDLDFRAGWDAATETGRPGWGGDIGITRAFVLMTRSRWDGFSDGVFDRQQPERGLIYHDCEVTNWANYAAYCDTVRVALLGCDLHQKDDALGGIGQSPGSQNPTTLGNRHGPYRSGVRNYETVMSCCSFLSRTGWFPVGGGGPRYPQSAEQPCLRLWSHFADGGVNARRHYHTLERCTFEGGDTVVVAGPGPNYNQGQFDHEINPKNLLIDKCLFVGASRTFSALLSISVSGVTVRNCFMRRTSVDIAHPNAVSADISVRFWSNPALGNGTRGPVEIYNNTLLDEMPANNAIRSTSVTQNFDPNFVPMALDPGHTYVVENNVTRIVNRASPVDHRGTQFLPLGTNPVAGFTLRHIGARWNFMPVRLSVGAGRQNETGTSGDWAPGTWISIPYPNQTGECAGAGRQLTQALVTGNSTQWHQMSVAGSANNADDSRNITDAALAPGSKGGLTFNFTATAMRVQNVGTRTFAAGDEIWLVLDQRDRLMNPLAGTGQNGQPVPTPAPGPGSAAIMPGGPGLWARDDFFGAPRNGQAAMGAFQPAA